MTSPTLQERLRRLRPRPDSPVQAAIAVGVALVVIVVIVTKTHGGGTTAQQTVPTTTAVTTTTAPTGDTVGPVSLDETALRSLASTLGEVVYWAGPVAGRRYELTRDAKRNVFLRYLPAAAQAGDKRRFLLVGTYPFAGAYEATKGIAGEQGAIHRDLAGGGIAVYRPSRPTNVYVAFPGLDYQIEVFAPSPAKAREVATSGRLEKLSAG